MIKVRYAPSPTGDPHIGNIRTALFNYLYARKMGGKFILRIEDSDQDRIVKDSDKRTIDILKILGLDFDEGPFYQSKNVDEYRKIAQQLIEEGKAYYCFCSAERLQELRKEQEKGEEPTRYDGKCGELPISVSKQRKKDENYVIRFKIPQDKKIKFEDLIHGEISFNSKDLDDFIIIKSDGFPTYHLASVADDHFMEISHVIRADEWISSTPKHILLYEALGWGSPMFAHLPIILGPDKTKLSKRHGATSAMELVNLGYLPSALINFTALLGWNPGDNQEIFTFEELQKKFSLDRVNKSPAVFETQKLDWINYQHLKKISDSRYLELLESYISKNKLEAFLSDWTALVPALKERIKKFSDIKNDEWGFAFRDELNYEPSLLVPEDSNREKTRAALEFCESRWKGTGEWSAEKIKDALIQNNDTGLSKQELLWPARVALSGQKNSPPIWGMAQSLGKEKSILRIKKALGLLI